MVVIGCGFMGKALLEGWLSSGVTPGAIHVQDPAPSDWLKAQTGFHLNQALPDNPAVLVIATKPQVLGDVLPPLATFGDGDTIVVTIATGAPLAYYEAVFGAKTPVVRAMPNLPAAVGAGITVFASNANVSDAQRALASALFGAVGAAVELEDEAQLHAVTGISGSGPAYVFAMAEAMTKAGEAMGLPRDLATTLAVHTVAGAGEMMRETGTDAGDLRRAVTSKGGTTAEALAHLLAPKTGLFDLMETAACASRDRSIALSQP
ncbi:pyrroline-5-carboxylate reductase [Marinovum sp. 2_MG-2023]|uniref:pyrroline-5-carboxylate reductase n=1 Tax=unclassified Marinovum TaxID=2647166 RepID=UPI0026E2B56E|nr:MULTISPECIES: pyrroline-5-carboxylate reductase [unclassified Marinovum]MDO6728987.1 pyrroline-5-carboxylate reductase [Marinovum sp. 2_MG-2023]MDO6779386.1 pyrroline-5-carboxylate reductase [Marinovum sp. 1_MG-2023]